MDKYCLSCNVKFTKKPKESYKQYFSRRFCSNKCSSVHNPKKFKKGMTPWNKNIRGVLKANKTSFKKGNKPWHAGTKNIVIGYWLGKKRPSMCGHLNSNWKGGLVKLVQVIRKCFEYKRWRSDIFKRDNYTCVLCYEMGGIINADHYPKMFSEIFHNNNIKSFKDALECKDFWDINNGRTLCLECHKIETKKQWKQK
jgi:hypothetical protein